MDDLFGPSPVTNGTKSTSVNFYGGYSSNDPSPEVLLKPHLGGGLGVDYSFSRTPSMHGSTFITVNLSFKNHSEKVINNIRMGKFVSFQEKLS